LTNVHGKRGAQGQSWVTLELFSVLKDDRTAAFSFSLCLWINSSFSICSKSADQIYPSTFSQFVITYSEGNSNFDVRMYANRAEVLFHRGSLHIPLQPQQRGFGQVIVGLGYNGYVDDILLWLEPVQDSLEEIFGTIGSESLVFGIAFGSELLLSNIHQRALESVKYEGFAYFMGPGFIPFEDDDENVIRFGFAPSSITLNFRSISAQQLALQTPPGQPSLHHSALSSDYYGSRNFYFSSTAAPIFVGIEGNSSGVSCQSESIVSCSFDVSDVELLPSTFSSLRIFSEGTNAQFGLDVEIHSRIFGITPSTPTFETSEMLSVDVSGGHHNGALMIVDPLSPEVLLVPCVKSSRKFLCSHSFPSGFSFISTPRKDGLNLWNAVIPPHVNIFFVHSIFNTHKSVRKENSTEIENTSVQYSAAIRGSTSFAFFSGGSYQYDVIVFFSSTVPSPAFVIRRHEPVDLSVVSSSGLGPACIGASIVNSQGSFLLTIPQCSIPSISSPLECSF